MAGKETVQLRDVCVKIGSGATPRGGKEAYKGGATSLIRSQNIYNEGFHRDGLVYIDDEQSAELRNVVLPPKEIMAAFTAKVAPLYAQITANLHQSRTLATLRDTLLPKLLSGELSVAKINVGANIR
ncbi:MAG: hypothetical protein DWH82_09880 [Planctomycetota bacterium]|nr:MAG: hypothetical protein DWH82_09880 [Planctomycetota bacterium]